MCSEGSSVSPDVDDGLQGSVDVGGALKSQSGCGWWAAEPIWMWMVGSSAKLNVMGRN
jgi:hypothetical protein